jgi:hypothetical protein
MLCVASNCGRSPVATMERAIGIGCCRGGGGFGRLRRAGAEPTPRRVDGDTLHPPSTRMRGDSSTKESGESDAGSSLSSG